MLSQLQSNIKIAPHLLGVGQSRALTQSPRALSTAFSWQVCLFTGHRCLSHGPAQPGSPPSLTPCPASVPGPCSQKSFQRWSDQVLAASPTPGQVRRGTLGTKRGWVQMMEGGTKLHSSKSDWHPVQSFQCPVGADEVVTKASGSDRFQAAHRGPQAQWDKSKVSKSAKIPRGSKGWQSQKTLTC